MPLSVAIQETSGTAHQDTATRLANLEAQIPALQAQIAVKDQELSSLRKRVAELEAQVRHMDSERTALHEHIKQVEHERDDLRQRLASMTAARDALRTPDELAALPQAVARRLTPGQES
jgi:chromosome segregation ATPase